MKPRAWIFLAIFFLARAADAAEIAAWGTPARKLQRGFLNVALAPIEISTEWSRVKKKEAWIPTWFTGGIKGSLLALRRAGAGVYEIVSFPLPAPSGYEPILQPEFAWELLPEPSEPKKK